MHTYAHILNAVVLLRDGAVHRNTDKFKESPSGQSHGDGQESRHAPQSGGQVLTSTPTPEGVVEDSVVVFNEYLPVDEDPPA